MKTNTTKNEVQARIEAKKTRSVWSAAVKTYAAELIDGLEGDTITEQALLAGADDWTQYNCGGNSLIYDEDIAARLCTPSELKRKRHGNLPPNSRESWLDCQARALRQAARMILTLAK